MTAIEKLARRLFSSERALTGALRRRDGLRAEVLARMVADGAKRIEVTGQGSVSYLEASTAQGIDAKACADKLEALGAKLRELGTRDVDDTVPMRTTSRAASIRITPGL